MRYRSVATGEVIIISSGDFARLVSIEYLNDILIDYDLARTFDRCLGQTYWQRVVRCNCFFWPKPEKYLNRAADSCTKDPFGGSFRQGDVCNLKIIKRQPVSKALLSSLHRKIPFPEMSLCYYMNLTDTSQKRGFELMNCIDLK